MKKIIFAGSIFLAFPLITFAATTQASLIDVVNNLFPPMMMLVPIFVSIALLGFFWGVAMFIWNAGDEKKRAEGRNVMLWGVAALFVFLSITGIISLLQSSLSVGGNSTLTPPPADFSKY